MFRRGTGLRKARPVVSNRPRRLGITPGSSRTQTCSTFPFYYEIILPFIIAMRAQVPIFLILFLAISVSSHYGYHDGMEDCIDRCLIDAPNPADIANGTEFNDTIFTENGTDTYSQDYEQCEQICKKQRESFNKVAIALIVIVVICLVICVLCVIVRVACFSKIATWMERRKRKPVPNNLTPDQFASYADEFQAIFTQGQRDMWEFIFFAHGAPQSMQWFSLEMKRLSDYEYSIVIKGQDIFGVWDANGFYVNTAQGPIAWWFKDYEDVHTEGRNKCIYQLVRTEMGNYSGVWHLKGAVGAQEPVNLQKRFGGGGNQIREDQIRYDIQSVGGSDDVL